MSYFLIILYLFKFLDACILNGLNKGLCIPKYYLVNQAPFCFKYLESSVCVPYFNEIWPTFNNKTIDETIEKNIVNNLKKEFKYEIYSNNLYSLPLINNLGCMEAYIQFICEKNFIPCEIGDDKTKNVCEKICKKFISKCGTWNGICDNFTKCYS